MEITDQCPWPRCRYVGEYRYYHLELCEKHWEHIAQEETGVGHALVAKHKGFGDKDYSEGCYCSHCRPFQDLPTPSWEQEEDDMLKVTVEDTKTGKVTVLAPVDEKPQSALPARPVLAAIQYPRSFRYTALVDGKHKVFERQVTVPVTLKNFKDHFGPERARFRMTPEQNEAVRAGNLTREEALAQWILENSTGP
jgi:hypothetical protein